MCRPLRRPRPRQCRPMKHPIWWALGAGMVVILAAMALPLWRMVQGPGPSEAASGRAVSGRGGDLPWQVQPLADGSSRALGLHLGRASLADARALLGDALQVAVVARLDEVGALEALAEPYSAGFVTGRLVLAFAAPDDALRRWRAHASGSTPMDGGVRRFPLRSADLAEAGAAPLVGLSLVPGVRLTEADVRQRFGAPSSSQALDGGGLLMRYPAMGVAISVAPGQRGLIQYVAPRDGARLGLAAGEPVTDTRPAPAAASR